MENNNVMQWKIILDGVKEATKDVQQLRDEITRIKESKVTAGIGDQLQKELATAKGIVNEKGQEINSILNGIGSTSTGITKFVDGYRKAIASATADTEKFHRLFKETGNVSYQQKSIGSAVQVRELTAEYEKFNKTLGLGAKNAGFLSTTLSKMKEHAQWMVSGGLLMGAIALPAEAVNTMTDVEQQMAGILQTMPSLYKDYSAHIVDQNALNTVTKEFIGIAEQFGFEVDKVIEAGKLWSRGYKDVNEVMDLTRVSTKLAIADMMDISLANRAVESTINAYKQQGNAVQFASHMVDSFTALAHGTQVSATDLSEALMRSASAANTVGVSYDELASHAASMAKATGQSGSTVGNALKTIYSSIHSSKAISDLEAMGIAVYKVGEDGKKAFRPVADVMTELMIKTKGTKENLEQLMQHVASGKMQWNRAAALFGSYSDFIKDYNMSISSSGMVDHQIAAQLDTIARKAEQVKASFTGLVMEGSESGLSSYMKSWLDDINAVLKGLQQIPSGVYTVLGTITKWAMVIYAAKTALEFLDRSIIAVTAGKASLLAATEGSAAAEAASVVTTEAAAVAAEGAAVATETEAAAMTGLGAVTTAATGGLNLVVAGLIAAGTGAMLYAGHVGEATTAMEQHKQKQEDLLTAKQAELDMTGKQTEFIGTLCEAYVEFQGKLQAVGDDEQQAIEIKKSMGDTITELTKLVGEEGVERLKASKFSQEAIKAEQTTHTNAANSIKTEIVGLKKDIDDYTDRQIDAAQARIDSLYKETEALSIYRRAQLAITDLWAGIIDKQISFKTMVFNNMPDIDAFSSMRVDLARSIDSDVAYRQSLSDHRNDGLNDDIAEAKAELAGLKVKRFQREQHDHGYSQEPTNGEEVEDTPPKNKHKSKVSNGPANPPADRTQQVFRTDLERTKDQDFAEAKIAADKYSTALETLNNRESVLGFTVENANEKLALMKSRINELVGQGLDYADTANSYDQQVNDLVASNSVLVNSLDGCQRSWASLTKEEKNSFIQANKESIQDEHTITTLIKLADEYRVKAQEAAKEANKLGNQTVKEQKQIPEKEYNKNMSMYKLDEELDTDMLGPKATDQQKKAIELKYSIIELSEAKSRLKEIEESPNSTVEEFKKQEIEVEKLKLKIHTLSDAWADVKAEAMNALDELLLQGKKGHDVWMSLWKDLAKESMSALAGVPHQQSLLGKIFSNINTKPIQNKTGVSNEFPSLTATVPSVVDDIKKKKDNTTDTSQWDSMSSMASFLGLLAHHEYGGIFDQEHLALINEGDKEEAVIPLTDKQRGQSLVLQSMDKLGMFKDNTGSALTTPVSSLTDMKNNTQAPAKNGQGWLSQASSLVGLLGGKKGNQQGSNKGSSFNTLLQSAASFIPKGTQVEASISPKAQEAVKNNALSVNVAQDKAHIAELQTQTSLMQQQNQMLLHMINNGTGNNGHTAQPMVFQQSMSNEELANQLAKMKSLGYQF